MFSSRNRIEHDQGKAVHLHHADEAGRGLEPDPVQPVGLHEEGLRNQLHRDAEVGARPLTAANCCWLVANLLTCLECKSTRTAESGEYTSVTGSTRKMSYHPNSNCSCQLQQIVIQQEVA